MKHIQVTAQVTRVPSWSSLLVFRLSEAFFPWTPSQALIKQAHRNGIWANWLPICLIHSPASISQLHALSSIDKIRLLLAMVPWEGSGRFPLHNTSWVAAAAPGETDTLDRPPSFPAALAAAAEAGADVQPRSLQGASQAFWFPCAHTVCPHVCTFPQCQNRCSCDHA